MSPNLRSLSSERLWHHAPSQGLLLLALIFGFLAFPAAAQELLKTLPRYARYERMRTALTNAFDTGALAVTWKDGGKAFEYDKAGKRYRYDIGSMTASEIPAPAKTKAPEKDLKPPRPARGRQYAWALSPDGKHKAFYRDRNLWLSSTEGTNELAITADGCATNRIKYGTATWTYGEELEQNTAIWWSSNNQKVAFYRIDESKLPDFYLVLGQTKIKGKLDVEPYPTAGGANPIVDLLIYDLCASNTVKVDVRSGKPFDNEVVGHYVYGIQWTHDGSQLLFHRTDRRQKVMELCAADPETGKCRVIVREEWLPTWVENLPLLRFLKDGRRFIWSSERTGWRNFYLYDLSGELLATLTDHLFEVADVLHVDEQTGRVYYTAHSGDNPIKMQLHSVSLNGSGEHRLTDPAFHHTISFAPDGRHYLDVSQTHDSPPCTRLVRSDGEVVAELAQSELKRFHALGLKPVELFTFKAADGQTPLYGMLHFPADFASTRKYPLLVSVYAGPATSAARETFAVPNSLTELGFLYAAIDSRTAPGRGKRSLDVIYQRLGELEIDDQAAGVKALCSRRYVDRKQVGIFGVSYGGTASALCLLRYPDVFAAAAASSAVSDFRNYDTIYTERYFGLPQDCKAAYDRVCLMTYAKQLTGRLLVYYGTADDNVHPSNALQFIQALQNAGKHFEVQVGPDLGHTGVNRERMMEFFIKALERP